MNKEEFLEQLYAHASSLEDQDRDVEFSVRLGGLSVYLLAEELLDELD